MPDSPRPTHEPTLTPQFCLDTTALRDFLRLSRSTVDDSISTHLNAMLTPARSNPFLPSVLGGQRSPEPPPPRGNRRNISFDTCDRFKHEVLFPTWRRRDRVLRYCAAVAAAPNAPPVPQPSVSQSSASAGASEVGDPDIQAPKEHRDYWGTLQTADERLDPYSARDYSWNRESAAEQLRTVLGNEDVVERIVRSRTWGVLGERCASGSSGDEAYGAGEGWRDGYEHWKSENG